MTLSAEWDAHTSELWQEIDGTLCYIDISGFTALSEKLARRGRIGAEDLTEVLNYVFGKMRQAASGLVGTLTHAMHSAFDKLTLSMRTSVQEDANRMRQQFKFRLALGLCLVSASDWYLRTAQRRYKLSSCAGATNAKT